MSTGITYTLGSTLIAVDSSRIRSQNAVAVVVGDNTITYDTAFPAGYTSYTVFIKAFGNGGVAIEPKSATGLSETGFTFNAVEDGTIDYIASLDT